MSQGKTGESRYVTDENKKIFHAGQTNGYSFRLRIAFFRPASCFFLLAVLGGQIVVGRANISSYESFADRAEPSCPVW